MTTTRGKRQTSRFNPFLALLLVLVAVGGTLVTLDATGRIDLGITVFGGEEKPPQSDKLMVILSARSMAPGEAVDLKHVWDQMTGSFKFTARDKEDVEEKGLIQVKHYANIKNRILARFKPANEAFVERDFLPDGTPAGPVGLVPSGMRMLTLPVDRIEGIDVLSFRDRFDLRMSIPHDDEMDDTIEDSLSIDQATREERLAIWGNHRAPRRVLLAQNAEIIQAAITKDRKGKVIIAVDPDDENRLVDAMTSEKTTIYCIAHAGGDDRAPRREADPHDPLEPYRPLIDGFREIEVYEGNERREETVRVAEVR
jgi:hypothetical protein